MAYDFGLSFQRRILAAIAQDPKFLHVHRTTVDPEFFTDELLGDTVSAVLDTFDRLQVVPSRDSLVEIIEDYVRPGRKLGEYLELIDGAFTENLTDVEFVQEQAVKFARHQAMERAIMRCADLIGRGDFSADEVEQEVREALSVGIDETYGGDDYLDNLIARFEAYGNGQDGAAISTGWNEVDDGLEGGLRAGELGVFIAPVNKGKSQLLVNTGYGGLIHGRRVAHFTLEMNRHKVARRYDMRITGMKKSELSRMKRTAVNRILELSSKVAFGLRVVEFPTDTMTVGMLRQSIMRLRQQSFFPDVLIVDYGDIMAPERRTSSEYEDQGKIFKALRGVAGEFAVPLWSATQVRRTKEEHEPDVITMEDVADSYKKCFAADVMISLSSTQRERAKGKARLFFAKNRDNESELTVHVNLDFSRSKVTTIPEGE